MIDPAKKSTEVPPSRDPRDSDRGRDAAKEVAPGVLLDPRLGIYHREQEWLAVSDLHFGYEVSRRIAGGLWPLWGMETIMQRLRSLVTDWAPRRLILVGDIVDSSAVPKESVEWLKGLADFCPELILIEGNHDRGEVKRHLNFVPSYRTDGFLFHHGHRDSPRTKADQIEITGHLHPSLRINDGAGTSLRLPAFTREILPEEAGEIWRLPAFSPWAGGNPSRPTDVRNEFRQWACGGKRVFEVE